MSGSKSTINLGIADMLVKTAAERALGVAGEHVLGVSNQAVPHETGAFEGTGATSQQDLTVAVSYRDVAYDGQAVQQHEDLTLKHDEGRSAKFLENAMNREAATVRQIVGNGLKKVL